VHTLIPEYASATSISTVMTMPFHAIPFEKKVFEEVFFSSNIIKTPHVPNRWSVKKRRVRKIIEKKKEKKRKKNKSFKSLFK
jgi:hypothetical protein